MFEKLSSRLRDNSSPITWFHCASLGEFEQGRPLMEQLKFRDPKAKILLTFFSPSGYEIRKDYAGADWVFYLPLDTVSYARKFIEIVKPEKVFFVKYEFWFNYLDVLFQKKIPTYFISVNVRPDHYFLKWYGSWALGQLKKVNHFFVQNQISYDLLFNAGITQCSIAGDTRFDRVIEISKGAKTLPLIEKFCSGKSVIVAGSSWREDEKLLAELMEVQSTEYKVQRLIVAPHEIEENSLRAVEAIFSASKIIRYSKAEISSIANFEVLLIDNIGMLSSLYKYSTISYIGGGFGKGIHNILEAAVFGKPVLFGPNFQKFEEAKELIKQGGAITNSTFSELENVVYGLVSDQKKYREKCEIARAFVHDNSGAVDKILKKI